MSLYNGPPRPGARGGRDQFSWDNVKADKDREYYLGHSVKALAGRWQKGRDVYWYTRETSAQDTIQDEIQAVKQREEELMMEALGLKPKTVVKPAPQLNKHDLDELIKGKQEEQEEQDAAAAAAQEAERMKGLGYIAGTGGGGPAEAVHTTLPGVGPAGPGSSHVQQRLPPPPPLPVAPPAGGRGGGGGARPGAALALASGMSAEQLKELRKAEKRARKEAKKEAKKAKKEAKKAKKEAKKGRREGGVEGEGPKQQKMTKERTRGRRPSSSGSSSSSSDGSSSSDSDGDGRGADRRGGRAVGGDGPRGAHPDSTGGDGPRRLYEMAQRQPYDRAGVRHRPSFRHLEDGPSGSFDTAGGRQPGARRQEHERDWGRGREGARTYDAAVLPGRGEPERGGYDEKTWRQEGDDRGRQPRSKRARRHDSPSPNRSPPPSLPPQGQQQQQQQRRRQRHDSPSPERGTQQLRQQQQRQENRRRDVDDATMPDHDRMRAGPAGGERHEDGAAGWAAPHGGGGGGSSGRGWHGDGGRGGISRRSRSQSRSHSPKQRRHDSRSPDLRYRDGRGRSRSRSRSPAGWRGGAGGRSGRGEREDHWRVREEARGGRGDLRHHGRSRSPSPGDRGRARVR